MRNGTQSSRLTLIDRNGREIPGTADADETFAEYQAAPSASVPDKDAAAYSGIKRRRKLLGFAVVSAGCAAAAVASGSYAFWLSRKKIADEAMVSVHGLLETCRERVARMENELGRLENTGSIT